MWAEIHLDELNSLVEDKAMLAENLEHWAERERSEGQQEGLLLARQETARNLLNIRTMSAFNRSPRLLA